MKLLTPSFVRALSVLLLLLVAPTLWASRYSPPSHRCRAIMSQYVGGIESYDMDNPVLFGTTHGSKELDVSILFEKGYIKHDWPAPTGCKYYLVEIPSEKSYEILCRVHGLFRRSEANGQKKSPRQQFADFCREKGLDLGGFRFDLSDELAVDISGPGWLIIVANGWYILWLAFFIPYVLIARPRLVGAGWLSHLYALGSSLIAGLFMLSLLNIAYVGQAVPTWRRYTYGSYPDGIEVLSRVSMVAFPVWWVVSFVALGILYRNNCSLRVPLVYILVAPLVLILGEMGHFLPFSLLTPLFGLYFSWAMRSFEVAGGKRP